MSYQNLEKALELAKQCDDYYIGKTKTTEEITKAEKLLGIQFSKQLLRYYTTVGYLSFFGVEIYSIYPNVVNGALEGDSFAYALHDREHYNLPRHWLPIFFFDDGYMGYLDYSQLNEEGEPPVIMATYNGEKYVSTEKVAEDFGDFILQLVEAQLADQ